jgi:hypothetical protein
MQTPSVNWVLLEAPVRGARGMGCGRETAKKSPSGQTAGLLRMAMRVMGLSTFLTGAWRAER